LTEENIGKFVKAEALPLIVDFNHETAQKVFGGDIRTHILMFLSKESGHYDKYLETQKTNAKEYKEKVCIFYLTILTLSSKQAVLI